MIKLSRIFFVVLVVLFLIVGCRQTGVKANKDTVINWNEVNPETVGVDSENLNNMNEFIAEHYSNINSVIVMRKGKLIFENYYNDYNKDSLFEIASATKTITSALIGIAIKEDYIEGVDEKVVKFFPEYTEEINNPKFKELIIEDLLTMTDGLDWNDWTDMNKKIVKKNPIKYAFGLSFKREPGEKFNYNTLDSQILSGIITKSTGMNELKFADKYLFGPLEIEDRKWSKDLQGNNTGGFGLFLRTRDMAKIGQLYLNKGKWNGNQIIPVNWIRKSIKVHSQGGMPHGSKYGYHLWVTEVNEYQAYFAGGFGGQFIYVVPELELVVAITSALDKHREKHRYIVDTFIVPATIKQ